MSHLHTHTTRLLTLACALMFLIATLASCGAGGLGSNGLRLIFISVTPTNPSIALGTTEQFTAMGIYSDSTTQDLTNSVNWNSSSTTVSGVSLGLATSLAVGSTTITAADVASGISGATTITVTPAVLTAITVSPVNPSIARGTSVQFTASGIYSDSSVQDLTGAVIWNSTNTAAATVSHGLAIGVAVGSTIIAATDPTSSVSGVSTLNVSSAVLTSIAVSPTNPSVALGTTQHFIATGTFSDNSTQDLSSSVNWSSSLNAVALVSNAPGSNGLATSLATGFTAITASDLASGVSGVTTLTVTPAVLTSIAVTPIQPVIALGTAQLFSATGTYSDSSTQDLTTAVTWNSTNTATVAVSNAPGSNGLATSVAVGTTSISATHPASGINGSTTMRVTAAVLTSITVTPSNPSIALGTAQQFVATGTFSDSSTQNLTSTVTWSSTNTAAAVVSNAVGSKGLAPSVSVGSTSVSAIDPASGVNGATVLSVSAAVLISIAVTPINPSIALGTSQQFSATGTYSDNSTQNLTGSVTWGSTNSAVATVSGGLATAIGVGSTSITAIDSASAVSGATTLSVSAAVLTSIAVSPTHPSVALGTTQHFVATGTFSDSSTQNLTSSVTWSSTNSAAAVVSNASGSNGFATTIAAGTTSITATAPVSGIHGATTLDISAAVLISIAVTPTNPSIALGTTRQFVATGTYSDSSTQDLTGSVTWGSTNTAVATVSSGLADAIGIGSANITATDSATGVNGSTTLTVTSAVLVSIEVTPTHPSIALGTTQQFVATGTFSDSSTQNLTSSVTWSSINTASAVVSNAAGSKGLATSVAIGTTQITATAPAGGSVGSTTLDVTSAVLISIAVTPTNSSIALGTSRQFTATGSYSDNSTQNLTGSVSWNSTNTVVAAVSNGLASAVGIGNTSITATDPASAVNGATVLSVSAAVLTSITVTPANPSIALGTTQQCIATGTFSDSSTQNLTSSVTWSSSNSAAAVVSNAAGSNGFATSIAVGTTSITAIAPASGIHGATTLDISAAVLISIAVTPTNPSIALGTTRQFAATGTYSDNSTQDLSGSVTWGSTNSGVASVSIGFATAVGVGNSSITAIDSASAISGASTLSVSAAVLSSIAVTPANPSIASGTTQQFIAIGTFSDSSTQELTSSVTWSSSDTGVAVVSNAPGSHGQATSFAAGTTTITAIDSTTSIGDASSLTVNAADLVSIAVTPTNSSIALGTTRKFTATGTYSDNSTQDLTYSVTWDSSSPSVTTVSNAPGSEGHAKSLALGSSIISATDVASGISGTATLSVSAAVLTSIVVTPANPSIARGTTEQFVATGIFSDSSAQNLTSSVTWSSTNTAVAAVSNTAGGNGLATSVAAGTTSIAAADPASGISGATTLTVTAAVLNSITVTPINPSIARGTTRQFVATGTYSDSSTQNLTSAVTWSSTNTSVATVSNAPGSKGLATSAVVGSTTISAVDSASGISGSTTLSVTAAVLTSITVTPANPSISPAATQQFLATGTYSDSSTQNITSSVTWSSSSAGVATISNVAGGNGIATGVALGSTTITAIDSSTGISGATTLTIADITFRAAASAGAASGVLSLTISTPAGTAAGDVMVAAIAVRPNTATITPPAAGWTLVRRTDNAAGTANSLAVYTRVATVGEPASHLWTFSASTGSAGGIVTFRTVDTSTLVNVESGQTGASSVTHTAPTVTTTLPNTMLVTCHEFASAATWTPPAGMTEAVDVSSQAVPNNNGVSVEINYVLKAAAGATGTKAAVGSNNADTGASQMLALRRSP